MKILEIDIDALRLIDKPTKFQNIILPDESFFFSDDGKELRVMFTNEYVTTIEQVRQFALKNFESISQKKFFFFYGMKQFGEERLAKYFQAKGYSIIQPEKFPLEVQLNILMNCENFASTIGSSSHNVIFMKDSCEVILIPRFVSGYIEDGLNVRQVAIDQIHDRNVYYIDSALSIFSHGNAGPSYYIISENLRKHFGDKVTEKYTDEDFANFFNYADYAKSHGIEENPKEIEYLQWILPEFLTQFKIRADLRA